jgi:hypothetical protein
MNLYALEGMSLAEQCNCPFIETSAKLGTNIEETYITLVREMRKNHPLVSLLCLQLRLARY